MYANNEIYNVLVSDANNCYKFLDSITFDNTLECIEMPNTFSPNDDGINDYWSLNFPNYEEASLVIFNKWGNQIWEFNGGNTMSWDGKTKDGLDIPSGTYYYTIELTDALGQTANQTGPITIIR
jgi:gliding motility-associated-like protein